MGFVQGECIHHKKDPSRKNRKCMEGDARKGESGFGGERNGLLTENTATTPSKKGVTLGETVESWPEPKPCGRSRLSRIEKRDSEPEGSERKT